MRRLEVRIRRSKRMGKLALVAVLAVSVGLGIFLVQGLRLAVGLDRTSLLARGVLGLALLLTLDVFSVVLIRRQHRRLDEARSDLEALVRGEPPE